MTDQLNRKARPATDVSSATARSNGTNREAALLAVLKSGGSPGGQSRSIADPWVDVNLDGVVDPPFDLLGLSMLIEQNSELGQCVGAMEVNIGGYGWRLKRDPYAMDPALDEAARVEHEHFEQFLLYADYNEESFTALRRRSRIDLETTGNAYWEVIRDDEGRICAFNQIPSYMMRLGRLNMDWQTVVQNRPVGRGSDRRFKPTHLRKRFRQLIQSRFNNAGDDQPSIVFFKQFGDPRDMLWQSGEYISPEMKRAAVQAGKPVTPDMLASEVIHLKLYSSRSPYGVPRFIGNLLSIFGGRAAEEINFTTFKNNNIPSMAVLVSNGMLTEGTIQRLTQFVETTIQGSDNYSKFLVVEAEGTEEGGDPNQVKLDIRPLTKDQHSDELFQNYAKNNEDRIRRAFRLPPIFVGRSDDYTRATADTSRKLADEQVFAPERQTEDHLINGILRQMGMLYHTFETSSPNVTDDEDLIKVLTGAEKAGGTTPRIARMILEDILGRDLGPISTKIEADVPFSLQMAEAVKNQAPANEVGQQVTALKNLGVVDQSFAELLGLSSSSEAIPSDRLEDVAINVGPQAFLIADKSVNGMLSAMRLELNGREMLVSDGHDALARVKFGGATRMNRSLAAKAVGLPDDEVALLYPDQSELWVHKMDQIETLGSPLNYVHPEGEVFARGVLAQAPEGVSNAVSGAGVFNVSPDNLKALTERVRAVQAAAPYRVRAMSRTEAARVGTKNPWQRAERLEQALRVDFEKRTGAQHRLVGQAVQKITSMIERETPLTDPDVLGLVLWGYAHPSLHSVLTKAEELVASRGE